MPKSRDYVPRRQGAKTAWAKNLKDKIPTEGPATGESLADVAAVETAAQGVIDEVNAIAAAKAAYKSAVTSAKSKLKTHLGVIRRHAKRIKTSGGYSEGIGKSLGIIGSAHEVDVAKSKPVLKISRVPSGYKISYSLLGFFHGLHIYRKRPTDTGFHLLATDNNPPYIDTNPMVDGTLYHAFFLLHDEEVGLQSAEAVVKL